MINADSASSNYQKQEWREFDYNICICFAKLKPEKQRGIIKAMAAHCNQVNFEERKGHFSKSTCAASETTTCGVCTRGALHTSAGTGELQGSEEGKCVATLGSNSLLQFGTATVLLLCTVGQEFTLDCWRTAWDLCDPRCAWSHWAYALHTLMKLGLFLSAIHCEVERNNLWVGSHSRTMHNDNN